MSDENEEMKDKLQEEQGSEATANLTSEKEAKSSRMDGAKAFFRALYAGGDEESLPEMGLEGTTEAQSSVQRGSCKSCEGLQLQLSEAERKTAEYENLYKRMMADFENFRRRVEREREEYQSAGVHRTVESLLPALDDMDRALATLTSDTSKEKLLEGIKLVFSRLSRCLEQVGVKPLMSVGEPFDPKFHEPVQEVETTEFPDGAVVQELRRGYIINDKVIRPALVNVASNSGQGQVETSVELSANEESSGSNEPGQAGDLDVSGEHKTKDSHKNRGSARSEKKDSSPESEGKVYDLSEFANMDDTDVELANNLEGYVETQASGNRSLDE